MTLRVVVAVVARVVKLHQAQTDSCLGVGHVHDAHGFKPDSHAGQVVHTKWS